MGIKYNKEIVTKDRRVMPSGPRDRQRKQQLQSVVTSDQSELIAELRSHINELQFRLDKAPTGGFTAEQVDAEIYKAIKEETSSLKAKYNAEKSKVVELEKEIASLKSILKGKEEVIEQLKTTTATTSVSDDKLTALLSEAARKIENMATQMTHYQTGEMPESDRPKMEAVFVDPIERESAVESHFEVEDISISEKEEMNSKVSKLKNLLGSLPLKRG